MSFYLFIFSDWISDRPLLQVQLHSSVSSDTKTHLSTSLNVFMHQFRGRCCSLCERLGLGLQLQHFLRGGCMFSTCVWGSFGSSCSPNKDVRVCLTWTRAHVCVCLQKHHPQQRLCTFLISRTVPLSCSCKCVKWAWPNQCMLCWCNLNIRAVFCSWSRVVRVLPPQSHPCGSPSLGWLLTALCEHFFISWSSFLWLKTDQQIYPDSNSPPVIPVSPTF